MNKDNSNCHELVMDLAKRLGMDVEGLSLVESIRSIQRHEGNFDCFARAESGFCDQNECFFYAACLEYSTKHQE